MIAHGDNYMNHSAVLKRKWIGQLKFKLNPCKITYLHSYAKKDEILPKDEVLGKQLFSSPYATYLRLTKRKMKGRSLKM